MQPAILAIGADQRVVGATLHDPAVIEADDLLSGWDSRSGIGAGLMPMLRRSLSDADACVRHTSAQLLGRAQTIDLATELSTELTSSNPITREDLNEYLASATSRSKCRS